jgi:hypothetical protein
LPELITTANNEVDEVTVRTVSRKIQSFLMLIIKSQNHSLGGVLTALYHCIALMREAASKAFSRLLKAEMRK